MVGGKHPGILARSKPYKEIDQSFLEYLKKIYNDILAQNKLYKEIDQSILEYLKKTYNDNNRITGME